MSSKKTIVLGITGGIAAYKMADFSHMLCKAGFDVSVVMTENAKQFIAPLTFETLTSNPCISSCFERNTDYEVEHIALAQRADLLFVSPATANIIAKFANGIADDALSTQALACTCPKIIAPAMNTAMLENPATKRNLKTLENDGWIVIPPDSGLLACGDIGAGKLPSNETLFSYAEFALSREKDMKGKHVLITAGATQEAIDPVRYITNHSSGKMGYALAKEYMLRGATVTLVTTPTALEPIPFLNTLAVNSAEEMFLTVKDHFMKQDIIIMVAAVADYSPREKADNKIKKADSDLSIHLKRTTDILTYLGEHKKPNQFICGFSMETENMLENSRKKLQHKKADMIIANNTKTEGAGFKGDTNLVTIITKDKEVELPLLSKADLANKIVSQIV